MAEDQDQLDVRRVLAGDIDAFEGIVTRWKRPLLNLAFRMCRDRDLAEDMAQEAFVKAYRGLSRWRGEGRFSTWLFALTLNHCRSRLRRIRPAMVELGEVPDPAAADTDIQAVEEGQRAEMVRCAVADLPDIYREAVALFYLEEASLSDAARALRVPEGTLKARLHRARAMLRARLELLSPLAAEE